MKTYFLKSILALTCLTMTLVPAPVMAQKGGGGGGQPTGGGGSCAGVSVYTSSPQVTRGYSIGIVAMLVNCSGSKQRISVNFTSKSACGTDSAIGYNRVALNPGQGIQVTLSYFIPADACPGVYTVTVEASGGKGMLSTATTTFEVV